MNKLGLGWGGDANYCIAKLVLAALPTRYAHWQEIVGALECAKMEIYRAHIGPYEAVKAIENGPVT